MSSAHTRLVTAAILIDGILAGASLDRTFIQLPAAPNLLRLRHAGDDDATSLQKSMEGFQFWQRIRGPLQGLAFVANVLSLDRVENFER
jgi:hypothetical protein